MSRLISIKQVKARKPHKCWLCGKTINKGEVYERSFSAGDGDIVSLAEHTMCRKVFDLAFDKKVVTEWELESLNGDTFRDFIGAENYDPLLQEALETEKQNSQEVKP